MSRGVSQLKIANEIIFEVFLELLHEKSFKDLSVKEIVHKAGVSRSTFYLHFADKYELMEEVRRTLNDRLLSFYQEESSQREKPITFYLCEHIFKYRSFYKVEFADAIAIQKLSDKLAGHLLQAFGDQDYSIFASYGTIGYLSFWVKNEFVMSPAEAAEILLKIGFTNWSKGLDPKLLFLFSANRE